VIEVLRSAGLAHEAEVVDIGAGTGISSEFFLRHGCRVTAVEPNQEMRAAAEEWLGDKPGFRAVEGTAEATGLPDGSFDTAAAFQAAHWFDFDKALAEMERLVRPGGIRTMAWNLRSKDLSEFDQRLERLLLERAVDYATYEERRFLLREGLSRFETRVFRHEKAMDWESLRGLVQSWSYVPAPGHERHTRFYEELQSLFADTNDGGVIRLRYDCHLYWQSTS
jgi:SAM-dependent methyltransferase